MPVCCRHTGHIPLVFRSSIFFGPACSIAVKGMAGFGAYRLPLHGLRILQGDFVLMITHLPLTESSMTPGEAEHAQRHIR